MFVIRDKRNTILKISDMVKCSWIYDSTPFVGIIKKFGNPRFAATTRLVLVKGLNDTRTGWFASSNIIKMNEGEKMLYKLEQQ